MVQSGVVPVFHNSDVAVALSIIEALSRGGATCVEFTNRGDHAVDVFAEIERELASRNPSVILGVGSVIDAPTAAAFLNRGAGFVVGPTFHEDVATTCNRRKVAYVPGCATATEVSRAHESGAEIVKLFPGGALGGPPFLKALRGPCPWISAMPTGGVDPTIESLGSWFDAGAACVGMGSKLITRDILEASDWDGLERAMADTLAIVGSIRGR